MAGCLMSHLNVIGANTDRQAFGECCGEAFALCWAGWAGSPRRCWMDCRGLWNLWLLFCLEIVWTHMPPRFLLLFKNSAELRAVAVFHCFQYNEASTGTGEARGHQWWQWWVTWDLGLGLDLRTNKLVLKLTEEDGVGAQTHVHRAALSVWLTSPSGM